MKRKTRFVCLLAVLLAICLLFGGCVLKNELLDGQMRLVVTALNANDVEGLKACTMPGFVEEKELEQGFDEIERFWTPVNAEEVKLVSFHKNTSIRDGARTMVCQGDYRLPRADGAWYLRLVYQETDTQKGVIGVRVFLQEEQGSARTVGQWVMALICLAAAIVTIIDILRHKPRKYGWYILLALFSFRFSSITNGAITFYLRIPLGAIVYWCMRKRILATAAKTTSADPLPLPRVEDETLSEKGDEAE